MDDMTAAAQPVEESTPPAAAPAQTETVRVSDETAELVPINKVVDAIEQGDMPQRDREQLYEDALDYFLDDENDVILNPIRFPIDIVRDIELENGDVAERRAFSCEIRTISDTELKEVQRRARAASKSGGPGGITMQGDSDEAVFHTLLAVEAITKPNIYDNRLIAKHAKPEAVLAHFMLPGERISLGLQILRLSGFGNSARSAMTLQMQEDVAAAKD